MTASHLASSGNSLVIRLGLALLGSYGATVGAVAFLSAGLASVMPRADALTLAGLIGIFVFLGAALWCFAEPSLARLAAVLLGGGGTCYAAAWLLALLAYG